MLVLYHTCNPSTTTTNPTKINQTQERATGNDVRIQLDEKKPFKWWLFYYTAWPLTAVKALFLFAEFFSLLFFSSKYSFPRLISFFRAYKCSKKSGNFAGAPSPVRKYAVLKCIFVLLWNLYFCWWLLLASAVSIRKNSHDRTDSSL